MDIEAIISTIIENLSDTTEVTANLQIIRDNFNELNNNFNTITEQYDKLKSDNTKLKEANLEYFLKLGHTPKNEDKNINSLESQPKKYSELFDEKGELK